MPGTLPGAFAGFTKYPRIVPEPFGDAYVTYSAWMRASSFFTCCANA
jgi:hypothetical protein